MGRHWYLNIFSLTNFFFFHPYYRAGAGVLFTLQQSWCTEMIWQRCGHDIFTEFGSSSRQELWNAWGEPKFKWSLVFSPVIMSCRAFNFKFLPLSGCGSGWCCRSRHRQGQVREMGMCCKLEMGRVSKQLVKQRAGHIWSAIPQPYQIIWLDLC